MPNDYIDHLSRNNVETPIHDTELRNKIGVANGIATLDDEGYINSDEIDKSTTSVSGNPISISGLKSNQLAINPIISLEPIQSGSGTPSPDNIREISGYDKIDVLSCGKNIIQGTITGYNIASNGVISADTDYSLCYARVKANQKYTISDGATQSVYAFYFESPKANATSYNNSRSVTTDHTFTSPIDGYAAFRIAANYGTAQLEEGDEATAYQAPIKIIDISESLGQTVYGSSLDIRTGKLVNKLKALDMSTMNWQYSSGLQLFYCYVSDIAQCNPMWCSYYKPSIQEIAEDYTITSRYGYYVENSAIILKDTRYTDATSLKNALTGQIVVYTTIESAYTNIQLTPHEINLLKDYVYISTNGTSMSFSYHNGEIATLGDISQLNDTVNLLADGVSNKTATSVSGNPISINGLKSNQLAINPIISLEPIQSGSGTPSPDNIRAISGYDKIDVLSCGKKNLFDSDQILQASGWTKSNGVYNGNIYDLILKFGNNFNLPKFKENTQYTISYYGWLADISDHRNFRFVFNYTDGTSSQVAYNNYTTKTYITGTSTSGKTVVSIGCTYGSSIAMYLQDIQIEEGASATTYVPYNKNALISESLGQTIVGGKWNVRSGGFDIIWNKVKFGDLTTSINFTVGTYSCCKRRSLPSDVYAKAVRYGQLLGALCEIRQELDTSYGSQPTARANEAGTANGGFAFTYDGISIVIYDNDINLTETQYDERYADIEIWYPLAISKGTIQLTPHEISLLKDYAYVSTNGTSISLDYHNREMASLADVSQLGETVNELGKSLTHCRLNVNWGNVTNETVYSYNLTTAIPEITPDTFRSISIMCAKGDGASAWDARGTYNYRGSSDGKSIVLQYECAYTQNSAISVVDVLYQS